MDKESERNFEILLIISPTVGFLYDIFQQITIKLSSVGISLKRGSAKCALLHWQCLSYIKYLTKIRHLKKKPNLILTDRTDKMWTILGPQYSVDESCN